MHARPQAPNPNAAPQESVADRIEYTERKKLLTKFYYGVCFYLTASICGCPAPCGCA